MFLFLTGATAAARRGPDSDPAAAAQIWGSKESRYGSCSGETGVGKRSRPNAGQALAGLIAPNASEQPDIVVLATRSAAAPGQRRQQGRGHTRPGYRRGGGRCGALC